MAHKMNQNIIKKVREHAVLYNYTLVGYRDPKARQDAWEEIGAELDITAEEARDLWDRLRRCYCNAVNRRREKKYGKKCRKPWKYEEQMAFIEPFFESRKIQGNVSESQTNPTESIILDEDLPDDEVEENLDRLLEENEEDDEETEPKRKILKRLQNNKKNKLIKKKTDTVYQILDIMRKQNLLQNMDDTDLFFLSMSRLTKQLPRLEQCNIKLTLSNAVLQAEMKSSQPVNHDEDSS